MTDSTEVFAQTYSVRDAAAAAGYRSTAQFVKVFTDKGYPLLRPSPRKRSVFVTDLRRFLNDHIQKKEVAN
jgi:hypothetical protein